MDYAAKLRQQGRPSRLVCYSCGLRFEATVHGLEWWQHVFSPGILTRSGT